MVSPICKGYNQKIQAKIKKYKLSKCYNTIIKLLGSMATLPPLTRLRR